MRLKQQHQAPLGPDLARRLQGRLQFPGMVAVIVHQQGPALAPTQFADPLESPPDPLEFRQRTGHGRLVNAHFRGDRHRRQGIEHIVAAGHVEAQIQRLPPTRKMRPETSAETVGADVADPEVRIRMLAVGNHRPAQQRNQGSDLRIVQTQHGLAVERQVVQKFDEGLPQTPEIAAIGGHMVGVDIGDDGDHRLQVEETGVALVRLGHQIMTRAQTGMTAVGVQPSADHIGGIQTALGQQRSHERGRRRLPMGARDGDAETETHQFRQHLRAGNHRDARLAGRGDLRVVVADGRRRDHHLGIGDPARIVSPVDSGAEFRQALGHGIAAQIRSADLIP